MYWIKGYNLRMLISVSLVPYISSEFIDVSFTRLLHVCLMIFTLKVFCMYTVVHVLSLIVTKVSKLCVVINIIKPSKVKNDIRLCTSMYSVCVCVHACACVRACVRVCVVMWLMAVPLSLTVWWRPGGVRGPLCWSCKPTRGYIKHTLCTMQEVVLAQRTGLMLRVPTIFQGSSILLGVLLPGLNSKLANRLLSIPWLGG